jgi:hypothetical protein
MSKNLEKILSKNTDKDLEEVIIKTYRKQESRIEELERRVKYCEAVASQYEMMLKQVHSKLKVLEDRQGNIQQVYDYMTRVGSAIAIKEPHDIKRLNPMRKSLPMNEQQRLELIKKFKFKAGDEVYYAREVENNVSYHLVNAVDIMDKHPRYCISEIIGYVDESKLFHTEEEAQWQLDEWRRAGETSTYC